MNTILTSNLLSSYDTSLESLIKRRRSPHMRRHSGQYYIQEMCVVKYNFSCYITHIYDIKYNSFVKLLINFISSLIYVSYNEIVYNRKSRYNKKKRYLINNVKFVCYALLRSFLVAVIFLRFYVSFTYQTNIQT